MRSLSGYRSAVEYLKLHDPVLFKGLNESTVRGWFVQGSYTDLNEKTKIALKRGKAFYKPSTSGRKPTLDNFPNIRQELVDTLQALRDSGTLGPPFLGENKLYNSFCIRRYCPQPRQRPANHESCAATTTPRDFIG